MKPVNSLSKRQRELLLGIWDTAHRALDKRRQPFKYTVESSDKSEWEDLINNGYMEPIPDTDDRFILTGDADEIFDELVEATVNR